MRARGGGGEDGAGTSRTRARVRCGAGKENPTGGPRLSVREGEKGEAGTLMGQGERLVGRTRGGGKSVTIHVLAMLEIYFVSVNYVFVSIKLMCVCVKLSKI
jgi:hypothetical protein